MIPFAALLVFHKNFYPGQGARPCVFVYLFKKQNNFVENPQEIISVVRFRNTVAAGLCPMLICIIWRIFGGIRMGKMGVNCGEAKSFPHYPQSFPQAEIRRYVLALFILVYITIFGSFRQTTHFFRPCVFDRPGKMTKQKIS